jgi:hypothetical protein
MKIIKVFVLCLWLTPLSFPHVAYSAQGDVTLDFGGLCPQVVIPGPPPFYLFPPGNFLDCSSAGVTYFRITDKAPYDPNTTNANRAQIIPASTGTNTDGADDTLKFFNFKIYAVTPTPSSMPQGYKITFWREHVQPPQTDGPGSTLPDIYYKTTTNGTIKRVINNWIKMDPGYVTHPVGSAEKTLGTAKTYTVTATTCPGTPAYCSLSGLTTSGKWTETSDPTTWLTNNRMLRAQVSFKFQNGNAGPTDLNSDWILLDTGVKINSQTNADPNQEECSDQYCKCTSGSTIMTTKVWNWMTMTSSGDTNSNNSAKIDMFTKVNWASLQQDMARGNGEYLTSLATLLEVPIEKQKEFFIFAQDQYRVQAEEAVVKRVEMLSRLQEAITDRSMLFTGTMEPTP